MAETTNKIFKSIQLLRNAQVAESKEAAIALLTANTSGIADGTPMVIRYGDGDKAILGVIYSTSTTTKVAYVDLNNDTADDILASKLDDLEEFISHEIHDEETGDVLYTHSVINEFKKSNNLDTTEFTTIPEGDIITVVSTVKGAKRDINGNIVNDAEGNPIIETTETEKKFTLTYSSNMPDDLTTPNAVGGVAKGVTAADLKKKTYGQIIDMILFPELNPTVNNPSATIAFQGGFTANGIYEIGAPAPVNPTNFNPGLTRGTCSVAGQPNKNRAGALISADSYIYYGGNTSNTTLPDKIVSGEMKYAYHAAYGVGDVLVTSYGNKATKNSSGGAITNPLTAGSVNSSTISIFGTYPYFANGVNASTSAIDTNLPSTITETSAKLNLQKYTDNLVGVKYGSESANDVRLFFEYPEGKTVSKVEFMDPGSKDWKVIASTNYKTESAGNKTIQGNSVKYNRLITTGDLMGAIQLRFTIN